MFMQLSNVIHHRCVVFKAVASQLPGSSGIIPFIQEPAPAEIFCSRRHAAGFREAWRAIRRSDAYALAWFYTEGEGC
jgi:hypothetical protein